MWRVLGALALGGMGATAQAAVMTFDALPDEGAQSEVYVEDGIRAVGQGGVLAFRFGRPGAAQLADGGTGFATDVVFTMDRMFNAVSFDISSSFSTYFACDANSLCEAIPFEFVRVSGGRDGATVADVTFDPSEVGLIYVLGAAFRNLESLVIGFNAPIQGPLPDGRDAICLDNPCTSMMIDNITLAPVPLPAGGVLLATALGWLGLAAQRRRNATLG